MGLFDFFRRKKAPPPPQPTEENMEPSPVEAKTPSKLTPTERASRRTAFARPVMVNSSNASLLQSKYIAFDVETTGLNSAVDRIIEIGAVLFIDGKPTNTFSSLVNPGISIPSTATSINHITNAMIASAPTELEVYSDLVNFLEGAIDGDIVMCAHNAKFDFNFLCETLSRLEYDARFQYIDTLSLSRRYIKGLSNYKQGTVERFYGLVNNNAHRAVSDAENCGKILYKLLSQAALECEDTSCEECYAIRDEAFEKGYRLWSKGEDARLDEEFEKALALFDQAREVGYRAPVIYTSYAKIYRKLKDYENEISILDEAIKFVEGSKADQFKARRDKAKELLRARQDKEAELQQKALERAEKKAQRQREKEMEAAKPKQPIGRTIIQCTDDGTVVKVYETIALAAKETGVSSKCIRDAACGKQKHAAGFCWKYADQ